MLKGDIEPGDIDIIRYKPGSLKIDFIIKKFVEVEFKEEPGDGNREIYLEKMITN